MSTAATAELLVRRAGTNRWIRIDPSTSKGQRLLALFHFTTPKETDIMSTTVPRDTVERMGALVAIKQNARKAVDAMLALPKSAWNWVVRTFHLQPVFDLGTAAFRTGRSWLSKAVSLAGRNGMIGLGLTAISTTTGRQIIGMALRPVGWLLGKVDSGVAWVLDRLNNSSSPLAIRLAGMIAAGYEFVAGNAVKALTWVGAHVSPYLELNSAPMRVTKAAGLSLIAAKAFELSALLPFGGFPLALVRIAVLALVLSPVAEEAVNIAVKAGSTVSSTFRSDNTPDSVAEAAEAIARGAAAQPVNRAERRAAGQKGGQRTAAHVRA